jgi:phosphate-selective porin OprO/OprP
MSNARHSGCPIDRFTNPGTFKCVTFSVCCYSFGVFLLCAIPAFFPSLQFDTAWAQSGTGAIIPASGNDARLDELLRRMEILEANLRESEAKRIALMKEMQRLKADLETARSGVTNQISASDERRIQPGMTERDPALSQEPLSAKDAKAPDSPGGLNAGWDKGFYVRSADENFEFRPVGILHVDFRGHEDERQINTNDTLASTFDIRRLRLGFEGYLSKDIGYNFEMNIDVVETELIFAYMNFGYIPWANLRAGQFKEPFSYEVLYPEKYLDFVERANITTSVAPAESIGVMAHNLGRPYMDIFEYGLGVFNGEGTHLNNAQNDSFEVAGRFALTPFAHGLEWLKKLKLAANVTYLGDQNRDFDFRPRTSERFEFFPRLPMDGARLRFGGDLQWYYGPYSLKAEYIRAEEGRSGGEPDLITDGWHVDATWLVTGEEKKIGMESGWELAARYEEIRVDAQKPFQLTGFIDINGNPVTVEDNFVRTLTLGVNKYINYNVKFQVNYEHDWYDNSFLTPTSRTGDNLLESGDVSVDKVLMRMQLFF